MCGEVFGPNVVGLGGEFNGETHLSFDGVGDFERTQPFSMAFWFNKGGSAGQELHYFKVDSSIAGAATN
jgi:hypothetical protein